MNNFKSTAEKNLIQNIKNIKLKKPFITIQKVQPPVKGSSQKASQENLSIKKTSEGMSPQTSVTGTKKGKPLKKKDQNH
jgi:hypothetical protein